MTSILLVIIYLAFISLGLPDELLGAGWPVMHTTLGVPLSFAGGISIIISAGTIISSLFGSRLTAAIGTGRVTALSVAMTALALFGFSVSTEFWMLCLWAIPYGLGAGSVDAALNNYVALHYESQHMSWLHCMWGIGATAGPYVMGFALANGMSWTGGYRIIAAAQVVLTVVLVVALPLWNKVKVRVASDIEATTTPETTAPISTPETAPANLSLPQVIKIPGAIQIMLCFFCYSAIETGFGLWSASYLTYARGLTAELAATYASFFFIGITVGRALSGFISMKLTDDNMIRLGFVLLAAGVLALIIPGPEWLGLVGLIVAGLGCAPIYPSIIHSTPDHFGAQNSLAIIGVQMASAYTGSLTMPPLFGVIANATTLALFPVYLVLLLVLMVTMHTRLLAACKA